MPAPAHTVMRSRKGTKAVAPPPLAAEEDENDVEVEEDDMAFFEDHANYAGFLSSLDKDQLDRAVVDDTLATGTLPGTADAAIDEHQAAREAKIQMKKEKAEEKKKREREKRADPEDYYEKRASKAARLDADAGLSVDPVDALPVKTLDGQLVYRQTQDQVGAGGSAATLQQRRALLRSKEAQAQARGPGDAEADDEEDEEGAGPDGAKKLTKAERRKLKKEQKKQLEGAEPGREPGGEGGEGEADEDHMEVDGEGEGQEEGMAEEWRSSELKEIEEEMSAEERRASLQARMAEVGTMLMADPERHVALLKELQGMCTDADDGVASLALLSSLAVYKDIVPGYRIRLPTEKEESMAVSKEVKKIREYEAALLRSYQAYVQLLMKYAKVPARRQVALRCVCTLLATVPHFNFRQNLLAAVIPRMDSADNGVSAMCCKAVEELLTNEGKHGGEATVEAVQLIADLIRQRNCIVRPQVVQALFRIQFDEDLSRASGSGSEQQQAHGKGKGAKGHAAGAGASGSEALVSKRQRKADKKRLASRLRKEVEEDFREASAVPSAAERRRLQTLTLAAVFETFFRVLKASLLPPPLSVADGSGAAAYGPRPLLAACLEGLAKFSHLISVDFMADLLAVLQQLGALGRDAATGELLSAAASSSVSASTDAGGKAGSGGGDGGGGGGGGGGEDRGEEEEELTVEERMRVCIVAFRIMRANMDALTVDLQGFYAQLYRMLLEAPLGGPAGACSGVGEQVYAEALQVMLWEGRHTDSQRCAAFIKRLSSSALHLDTARTMAALVMTRQLLQRHSKCRNLLDNDGGGGSIGGVVAVYRAEAPDPELSGALSTVLWELPLLARHFHPAVRKLASDIMHLEGASAGALSQLSLTPTLAVANYSVSRGGFRPAVQAKWQGTPGSCSGSKKGRRWGWPHVAYSPLLAPLVEETERELEALETPVGGREGGSGGDSDSLSGGGHLPEAQGAEGGASASASSRGRENSAAAAAVGGSGAGAGQGAAGGASGASEGRAGRARRSSCEESFGRQFREARRFKEHARLRRELARVSRLAAAAERHLVEQQQKHLQAQKQKQEQELKQRLLQQQEAAAARKRGPAEERERPLGLREKKIKKKKVLADGDSETKRNKKKREVVPASKAAGKGGEETKKKKKAK